MIKTCNKCKENKHLSEFSKNITASDGLQNWCKLCRSTQASNWQKNNPDKNRSKVAKWKKAHPKKNTEQSLRYQKKYPEKINAKSAMDKASKSQRTPLWLTQEHIAQIGAVYLEAKLMSFSTGVKHEVDHIVPLRGQAVSGLHVPWNLQVILKSENASKGNKFK